MYHIQDMMFVNGGDTPVAVGSPEWFSWLREVQPPSFSLHQEGLTVTLRAERRGAALFWYAYHKQQGRLRKVYAGPSSMLTQEHLTTVLTKVTADVQVTQQSEQGVRLLLLGTPALYVADQPLPVSAKTFVLLAYLTLTNTSPTREQLFAFLWPESSQEAARKNLQNMFWQIRSLLSKRRDLIRIRSDGHVMLASDIWVDARTFLHAAQQKFENDQQVTELLSLYRGQLLDGLTGIDAASVEHWILNERERFTQACLRLLTMRIETLHSTGAWAKMLEVAQQALAIDSLQEPLHRFAMLAYARLGQRAEALRQYEHLRVLLNVELGIAPLPETEALLDAIRRGTIAAFSQAGRHITPQETFTPRLPFVGRRREREALNRLLQQMLERQQAQVVALTGELGIGKSRLWREWSAQLLANTTLVECHCLESTQTIPLAPFTRLVTDVFARPHAPHLESLWLAELSRLAPELKIQYPALPSPVSLPPEQERGRLFAACLHALLALGKPPMLFFLDDLHWADQTTLDWLAYCLDHSKHLPLLCIIAYRPQEVTETLDHLLATWERLGVLHQITVEPLSLEETATLIDAQAMPPAWKPTTLHTQSAGNPYYLGELLQTEVGRIPPALSTLIQSRLSRLLPVARQMVQAAAILDPDIDIDLLRATSGRNEDETLDALDSLLETSFLREVDSAARHQEELYEQPISYMFSHPFVATILRESLSSIRRVALHRRAAETLVKRYAQQLPPLAGRLFKHYHDAGQRAQAAYYAEIAGNYALGTASSVEAEDFFQHALELETSVPRHIGLALAQTRAGKIEAARATFLQALQVAAAQQDAQSILIIVSAYFETYLLVNQFREAIEWAEQPDIQANLSIITPDILAIIRGLILVMKYRLVTPSLERAEQESVKLLGLLKTTPNLFLASQAYQMLATTFAEQGRWHEAIDAYRHVEQAAHALNDIFHALLARNDVAYHAILLGDLTYARKEVEAVLALVKRYKLQAAYFYVYSTYGELWLAEENWDEAERWLKRALAQIKQRNDTQAQVAELYASLGRVARGRGDLATAIRLLKRASSFIHQAAIPFQRTQIDLWLADLYSISAQENDALALLEQIEPFLQDSGWRELQRRATDIRQRLHHLAYEQPAQNQIYQT